ncbi:Uncharacterized protein GBIM_20691 [Gryllus bimaculatus]|nr:Uncharacterized protein GBIM_20691 [Gryllus bimaculatus]
MAHILASYSILGGVGVGLAWSSTFVAMTHYFSKYRGQAIGLSMVGTAIGFMAMPQAVQLLLTHYDFRGAVLILGGVALNGMVGALLLQPVKWHLKRMPINTEAEMQKSLLNVHVKEKRNSSDDVEVQWSLLPGKPKIEITLSDDTQKNSMGEKRPQLPRITSSSSMAARRRKESVISNISSLDFTGSTVHIASPLESDDEEDRHSHCQVNSKGHWLRGKKNDINENTNASESQESSAKSNYWKRVVDFFDLDLLKDHIYLNILFGLSIFYVAELNFKMVVPFFLADLEYSKSDVAFYLSMTAIADVLARIVLPPICDRIKITRRTLFAVASVFLGLSRSALAEQTEYVPLMIALAVNGFFRGATLINFTLTIAEHCSLEKLPAAFGLHMVAKGIFIVVLGPLIGMFRDVTDSYSLCIHFQTVFIFLCPLAWGIEYFVLKLWPKSR